MFSHGLSAAPMLGQELLLQLHLFSQVFHLLLLRFHDLGLLENLLMGLYQGLTALEPGDA